MSTSSLADVTYLTAAETAKYVRQALRDNFPGVKFSVRSSTYSGGASISVRWTDGPSTRQVDPVLNQFEGANFDGSIDLKCYNRHYIMPDGSVHFASTTGTQGSMGYIPAESNPRPEGARLVSFGANYVSSAREITDWQAKDDDAAAYIRAHCHCEGEPPKDMFGNQWVANLSRNIVYDRAEGEPFEAAYERIVMGRVS